MDRGFAARYILSNFEESDRLAVVVLDRRTGAATQRINTAERIASGEFQAWLRHQNAQGRDIYLSMNVLQPVADRRTKNDIGTIRHIYLDFDEDADASVDRLIGSCELPVPNCIVKTSHEKRHVIWRVDGFTKEEAEHLQRNLAREWGADPAATDCARVLRLPGFYNHKYGVPYRVRTESESVGGTTTYYRPRDFPDFSADRLSPAVQHRAASRSRPPGALSQSERDWAFAKRALARGESMESVIAAITNFRHNEKPDPEYYATHTVRKAAAALAKEQPRGSEIVSDLER